MLKIIAKHIYHRMPIPVRKTLHRLYAVGNRRVNHADQKKPESSDFLRALQSSANALVAGNTLKAYSLLEGQANDSLTSQQRNIKQYYEARLDSREPHITASVNSLDGLKICVYTANVGCYDLLRDPIAVEDGWDYLAFGDLRTDTCHVWSFRTQPYYCHDATRVARFVKTHPHWLLPETDIALWIDSNIIPLTGLNKYVTNMLEAGASVATVRHPLRDDAAEEAAECIARAKDRDTELNHFRAQYKTERRIEPELAETNLCIFDLRDGAVCQMLDDWWAMINAGSRRDQLYFTQALAKHKLTYYPLLPDRQSARESSDFALLPHGFASLLDDALASEILPEEEENETIGSISGIAMPGGRTDIAVVVCVHNALDVTRRCLASVIDNADDLPFTLVIVDDGSDPITQNFLEKFVSGQSTCILIRNETARGYTHSANTGVKAADAEFTILLNSDTIVPPGWLTRMQATAEKSWNIGLVGPLSNAASYQSVPGIQGKEGQTAVNLMPENLTLEEMNRRLSQLQPRQSPIYLPILHGFCLGIRRTVFESVGYFDEELFPRGFGEENDFCFRAADQGFGLSVASDLYVYHEKTKSYANRDRIELAKKGRQALIARHGENRLKRAITDMAENPHLEYIRWEVAEWYKP